MPATMTGDEAAARRAKVLSAARWCFLNFGFVKTSFEDIAKRAKLSRTLLYRLFKDKEDTGARASPWLESQATPKCAVERLANGAGLTWLSTSPC